MAGFFEKIEAARRARVTEVVIERTRVGLRVSCQVDQVNLPKDMVPNRLFIGNPARKFAKAVGCAVGLASRFDCQLRDATDKLSEAECAELVAAQREASGLA